jgi:hypothetical protein
MENDKATQPPQERAGTVRRVRPEDCEERRVVRALVVSSVALSLCTTLISIPETTMQPNPTWPTTSRTHARLLLPCSMHINWNYLILGIGAGVPRNIGSFHPSSIKMVPTPPSIPYQQFPSGAQTHQLTGLSFRFPMRMPTLDGHQMMAKLDPRTKMASSWTRNSIVGYTARSWI